MFNLECKRTYLFCNFENGLSCQLNGDTCKTHKAHDILLGNITAEIKQEAEAIANLTTRSICILQGIGTQGEMNCDIKNVPALILLSNNAIPNLTSIFNSPPTRFMVTDTDCNETNGSSTTSWNIVSNTECYFYPITTAVTTTLSGTSMSINQSVVTDITTQNKQTNSTVPSTSNGQTPQVTSFTSTEPDTQRTEAVINITRTNTTTLSTNLDTTNESFFFSFNQKTTHPYPITSSFSPTKDNLRSSSSNAVVWGLVGVVVLFVLTFVILASIFIFRRYRKKKNTPKAFYNVAYSVSERNDGEIHISQRDAQGLSQPVDPRVLTYETPISMSQIDVQDDADHYYTIPNNFDFTPSYSCKDNQNSVVTTHNEYFVVEGNNSANHDIKADSPAIMPDLLDSVNIYDHLGHGMDVEEDIITGNEYHTLSSVAAETSSELADKVD